MQRDQFILEYSDKVNANLRMGIRTDQDVYLKLKESTDDESLILLEHLHECFENAIKPTKFVDFTITTADENLEQAYELLRTTFDPSALGVRLSYTTFYSRAPNPEVQPGSVLVGRSFRVSGHHKYDTDGYLMYFEFDPLQVTESAICVINGSLFQLSSNVYKESYIAGIGHLATRPAFRRQGHGRDLAVQLESALLAVAEKRSGPLRVIMLEAEGAARPFWTTAGYRWPFNCQYYQPPISFNLDTGEPDFAEVPELLMVKLPGAPTVTGIELTLLEDTVKTIYEHWYLSKGNTVEATTKINDYVMGKLFSNFKLSIGGQGEQVSLLGSDTETSE